MGLAVSEEYLTIAEDIFGLDHHLLQRNKTVYELLICYVHIVMYVELLRHLDSDGSLV